MLYGITASGRQHSRILLSCTKTHADLVIRYALYISFKNHSIGHIVTILVPFIEYYGIPLPEIGKYLVFNSLTIYCPSQKQIRLMRVRGMVFPDSQVVQDFAGLTLLRQRGKP